MKKYIKTILIILLTLGLILITMSFIIENAVVKTFSQEILSKKYQIIFWMKYFRIAMLLTCIITIIGLAIIEKNKLLGIIQISSVITVIFTIIAFVVVKLFSNFIDQKLAGGWLSNINLSLMIIFIIIELIISLALFIKRKNLKFNKDN